mmetsp:Transcript_98401/g.262996  ORF Transcript_98401/g.262996 Transcript_98401/m.262996 type:complete len:294 (-) Transcript_98401:638-1519(-)
MHAMCQFLRSCVAVFKEPRRAAEDEFCLREHRKRDSGSAVSVVDQAPRVAPCAASAPRAAGLAPGTTGRTSHVHVAFGTEGAEALAKEAERAKEAEQAKEAERAKKAEQAKEAGSARRWGQTETAPTKVQSVGCTSSGSYPSQGAPATTAAVAPATTPAATPAAVAVAASTKQHAGDMESGKPRVTIKIGDLRYCQDSISPVFKNGMKVSKTVQQLRKRQITPEDLLKKFEVSERDGSYYVVRGNRRLFAMKQAGLDNREVRVNVARKVPPGQWTTTVNGKTVKVRGAGAGCT